MVYWFTFIKIKMKHLLTCLALGLAFAAGAQQMPYNPDANADLFIGVDDVLGILGLYDTPLMQPELTCDFEGTEFESLIVGAINGDIIIDSVYVEYLNYDTLTYYTPGCPDLVIEPIILERGYMMLPDGINESGGLVYHSMQSMHFGFSRQQKIIYNEQNNAFNFYLRDQEIGELPSYSDYGYWWSDSLESSGSFTLPFPSEFEINEDGYQVFGVPYEFPVNAENFRAIPFWHNAE